MLGGHAIDRLIHADAGRKTRFHTLSNQLVISPDMLLALASTMNRVLFKQYSNEPWLTYPAIRFLTDRLRGRRLFEYGSGTSTLWYAQRCREVYSIENNAVWFETVKSRLGARQNASVRFCGVDSAFVRAIGDPGGRFDAIVIDSHPRGTGEFRGSDDFRVACLRYAMEFASRDCLFVIDNTDANKLLSAELDKHFSNGQVRRFSGWAPGIFHPNETTIVCAD